MRLRFVPSLALVERGEMEYMCDIGYIVERADINFCALGNVVIQYF